MGISKSDDQFSFSIKGYDFKPNYNDLTHKNLSTSFRNKYIPKSNEINS